MTPIHWSLAGAAIALVTLTLLVVGNRRLGVSSGLEDICSLVLDQPFYKRGAVTSGRPWRLPFLGGLLLGGGILFTGFAASALAVNGRCHDGSNNFDTCTPFYNTLKVGTGLAVSGVAFLAAGTHTVEVAVVDSTSAVRNDPGGLLTGRRTWTLSVQASTADDVKRALEDVFTRWRNPR